MKILHLNRKAQVQQIAPAIMALLFAAIILVMGLIVTSSMIEIETVRTATSGTITNESAPFNTTNSVTLAALGYPAGACGTITQVRNGTVGGIISSGNYTQTNCVVVNTTATFATEDWKIDYPYTRGGEAYVSGNDTVKGLATFADFWEIIVLAIIISVVIGLLLVTFGGSTRR